MGKIYWDTDCNAPCVGMIVNADKPKKTILVQTDWNYPGVASTFGWKIISIQQCNVCNKCTVDDAAEDGQITICEHCDASIVACPHDCTDGTVDCKYCGASASSFIDAAGQWLQDNDGATVDDPGYFS